MKKHDKEDNTDVSVDNDSPNKPKFEWSKLLIPFTIVVIIFAVISNEVDKNNCLKAEQQAETYGFTHPNDEITTLYYEDREKLKLSIDGNPPLTGTLGTQDVPLNESSEKLYSTHSQPFALGDALAITFGDPVQEIVIDFGEDRWHFAVFYAKTRDDYEVAYALLDSEFKTATLNER